MTRAELRELQSIRSYPSVSILLPTHRARPENRQDPIRVKNLVREANERLQAEFGARDAAAGAVRATLEALAEEIDYAHALDGLALFANATLGRIDYLPFPVQERVVVDASFATRDLVRALNRVRRYRVLALGEKPARLYEGLGEHLEEVTVHGFPWTHTGPGGTEPLPHGFGIEKSPIRDEHLRRFLRQVHASYARLAAAEPLPLVVVGVERHQAFFKEMAGNTPWAGTVTGAHVRTPAHELARLVWPLVQAHAAREAAAALDRLAASAGQGRLASGLGNAWRPAHAGRGAELLVEESYRSAGLVDAESGELLPADDPAAPGVLDDAVDEIIETVIAKGGRVVFVGDGALEAHQRLALVLRF